MPLDRDAELRRLAEADRQVANSERAVTDQMIERVGDAPSAHQRERAVVRQALETAPPDAEGFKAQAGRLRMLARAFLLARRSGPAFLHLSERMYSAKSEISDRWSDRLGILG
jgi:hypothetical protein